MMMDHAGGRLDISQFYVALKERGEIQSFWAQNRKTRRGIEVAGRDECRIILRTGLSNAHALGAFATAIPI
jgi:hypothetical protein